MRCLPPAFAVNYPYMGESIRVTVLAFGSAAGVLGWHTRDFTLAPGASLRDLIDRLEQECPRLAEGRGRVHYALNEQYAGPDAALSDGDEVAVIPPVSGGSVAGGPAAVARLTREPIDVPELCREVEHERIGAVATFVGVVRAESSETGQPLEALEYSAYQSMALREMQRLCDEALATHALHAVRLVHRLGVLPIGDASVAVVASAPHRAAAFDACRWLIEELKKSVPIFKRELWQGGGSKWVDAI